MALAMEIYQAFEDVVGKNNISKDPAILETYRCISAQTSSHYGPFYGQVTPCPQAVILPENTDEVQKIVKLCNKFKLKFKASTTFWASMGYVGSDYAIQLDMRRMRALEIDEKNQTAIIEPYAIGAVVQAEAMKVGLNCNLPGVGCSSSIVASTAGWGGIGPSSLFMGNAGENLLGAEWVLPDGEIIRSGSIGSGAGWFCGEGPGPSPRAIFRGSFGAIGEMGVCTKIAIRLHPWPGPTYLPSEGTIPAYKAVLPDNFKCYTLCFPTWDAWAEAVRLCYETDVLYLGHRQFNMFGRDLKAAMIEILTDPDKQLCDLPALMEDPEIKKQTEDMKLDFQIVIAGMTKRNMEYKEKVINKILEITGGWKSEMMNDPELADWALLYLLRMGRKNLNFVLCGGYEGNFGLSSNLYVSTSVMEEAAALKKEWENKTTAFAATGGDSEMGSLSMLGGGGTLMWEFFTCFDPYEKESVEGSCEFIDDTQRWMFEKGIGLDMGRMNSDLRGVDGYDMPQEIQDQIYSNAPQPHVFSYQWKIRELFNPNHLGGSYYRTLNPEKV